MIIRLVIRCFSLGAEPQYCDATIVEVQFTEVDNWHPEITRLVGPDSQFALSDNKGRIAQRNGENRIRVYITLCVSENWAVESGILFDQPEHVRTHLLQLFANWNDVLLNCIRHCDANFIPRPLYMLPIDHRWEMQRGITLLADAAHLMPPLGGEGVYLAMLDATELALAIVNSEDLTEAIHDYEQKIPARAAKETEESVTNLDRFIASGNTAKTMADFFKQFMGSGPPNDENTIAAE